MTKTPTICRIRLKASKTMRNLGFLDRIAARIRDRCYQRIVTNILRRSRDIFDKSDIEGDMVRILKPHGKVYSWVLIDENNRGEILDVTLIKVEFADSTSKAYLQAKVDALVSDEKCELLEVWFVIGENLYFVLIDMKSQRRLAHFLSPSPYDTHTFRFRETVLRFQD